MTERQSRQDCSYGGYRIEQIEPDADRGVRVGCSTIRFGLPSPFIRWIRSIRISTCWSLVARVFAHHSYGRSGRHQ